MSSRITGGILYHNDLTSNARGGTELLAERLVSSVPADTLKDVEIHISRVGEKDLSKKQVLWCHDLAQDPAVAHLRDGGWKKFDVIVFVSNWQQQMYNLILGVPYDIGVVIENSIEPIEEHKKPTDKLRLMYYSTPHRGLDILYAAYDALHKKYGSDIELNVFSSFDLYGWGQRDEEYKDLLKKLQDHKGVNYSKSVPNTQIREELKKSHMFVYPSTWQETSCLCLIEAMSAGLTCVHSSLGALPETSMKMTEMYGYTEDKNSHASTFHGVTDFFVRDHLENGFRKQNPAINSIINNIYNKNIGAHKWNNLLLALK